MAQRVQASKNYDERQRPDVLEMVAKQDKDQIMSTAHQTNNIHPNSLDAFVELDLPQSEDRVFQVYKRIRKGLTDRDVLFYLTRKRRGDMNIVRPRVTAMIKRLGSPLVEIGKTECKTTGRRVRVVMYTGEE